MMIPFTPSSYHRARQCPASCVLPRTESETSDAAQRGTNIHRFVERAAAVGRDAALAEMAPDALGRDVCEALSLGSIPIDYLAGDAEAAYAYDVATERARRISTTGREYGELSRTEIAGTIDAIEHDMDRVIVSDLKTGQPSESYGPQVSLYALMAARAVNVTMATCQVIYIGTDGVRVERWDMDADDLDGMHLELVDTVERVESLRGKSLDKFDVSTGEHCKYCPAKDSCPSRVEAAQELATLQPSALAAFDAKLATDEGTVEAWERLPILEELVATMRQRLDARVISQPVTMADGSTLGAVKTERRSVKDARAVFDLLADSISVDAANAAVKAELSTTLGAIEKAAGARKREVIDALTASGAIGSSVSVKAGVVRAKGKTRAA